MTPEIDVVLFDLGGVVVDVDHRRGAAFWDEATGSQGPSFEACFFESSVKARLDDGRQDATSGLGEVATLSGHIDPGTARDAFCELLSQRPEMTALINALAAQVRCAVISNTDPIHADWIEANCGIEASIETWVYSFDEKAMKPGPELFEAALRRVGSAPERTFILDDRADNIAMAASLGLITHHFKTFDAARDALRSHGFVLP
ncbi:MAG: HAD superfamily hydrolase (TIGR01509 family) [Myxococcota bacterium]